MRKQRNDWRDRCAAEMISIGRLLVDVETGTVLSTASNTPTKAIGSLTKKGYLIAAITWHGKLCQSMIHRIVWIAAHGIPADPALQINHINGNKLDNRLANLELVTGLENMRHAARCGLTRHLRGEAHGSAKLTDAQVKKIRVLAAAGTTHTVISREFGVSRAHVRRIVLCHNRVGPSRSGSMLDGQVVCDVPDWI